MMRKLIPLLLVLVLLMDCASAQSLLTAADNRQLAVEPPQAFTVGVPADAAAAAQLLGTDADSLQQAMLENGIVLLLTDPEGCCLQLQVQPAGTDGLSFSSAGRKKLALLAEKLAAASGQNAQVIRLYMDAPSATESVTDAGWQHCHHWILLSGREDTMSRTDAWVSCEAGLELTLYCDWPTDEAAAQHADAVNAFLYTLLIQKP